MVFISQLFDHQVYKNYLHKFGIGQSSGIDLEEETTPRIKKTWREIDYATTSFGQGIATTPMQIITAVAAIANGGKIVQPQVVDKIVVPNTRTALIGELISGDSPEGQVIDIEPAILRQVISKESAAQMTDIMINAVTAGEAQWAVPQGYSIAGKTGTAQIPVEGKYDEEKTITSFVGFAPAHDPKFIMLVTLHEPQTSPWGSETAAPLWFDIAQDLFLHWGIAPEN